MKQTTSIEQKKLDVLLHEHEQTCSQIHQLVNSTDKMASLASAAIGFTFLYGIQQNLTLVVVSVPYLIAGLLLYYASVFNAVHTLGGYRKYLEKRINFFVADRLLTWEDTASHVLHKSYPPIALAIFFALTYVTAWVIAIQTLSSSTLDYYQSAIQAGYVVSAGLVVLAYRGMIKAHDDAFQAASKEGDLPVDSPE